MVGLERGLNLDLTNEIFIAMKNVFSFLISGIGLLTLFVSSTGFAYCADSKFFMHAPYDSLVITTQNGIDTVKIFETKKKSEISAFVETIKVGRHDSNSEFLTPPEFTAYLFKASSMKLIIGFTESCDMIKISNQDGLFANQSERRMRTWLQKNRILEEKLNNYVLDGADDHKLWLNAIPASIKSLWTDEFFVGEIDKNDVDAMHKKMQQAGSVQKQILQLLGWYGCLGLNFNAYAAYQDAPGHILDRYLLSDIIRVGYVEMNKSQLMGMMRYMYSVMFVRRPPKLTCEDAIQLSKIMDKALPHHMDSDTKERVVRFKNKMSEQCQ